MKNILVILCAALALAACSSAPKSTNFDFANGCSVVLPSDWDVVPGDDTMPNTVMALAPVDNGFRSQMRIDALRPFDMEKGETALKLKESLEGKSSLLEPPALVKISGEPSVAFSRKGKENSTENALLTVDVTHYGYLICADDNIYSMDFACLASQADEVKGIVDEAVYSFQTPGSKKRAQAAEQAAREEAEARAEAERKIAEEESAFEKAEETKPAEEESFAAAEEEARRIEAEAKAEAKAKAQAKAKAEAEAREKDAKELAREKVEAAKAEAQKAQDAAVASARAAREAAKEAQAKAEALSAAQNELDKLNGQEFVQLQQPEIVVEKETPAAPSQPTQPAQPTFFESEVTVTPQPQSMEIKVTAPQQTAPTAPAAPSAPAAPQTSPMKKTQGGLVIEMQTVN